MGDLKEDFSLVLSNEYGMNENQIREYWANKEREEKYDTRLFVLGSLGFLSLTTAFIMNVLACNSEVETSVRFVLQQGSMGIASIGGALGSCAIFNPNPYESKDNKTIDKAYRKFKRKYRD